MSLPLPKHNSNHTRLWCCGTARFKFGSWLFFLLGLGLSLGLCFSSHAQLINQVTDIDNTYVGTTAIPFLSFPIGAHGAALGQASLVLIQDATSTYWNPAALGLLRHHQFSFSHCEMFMGVRNEYLAIALPRDYLGTFAFHSQMFTGGSFGDYSRDEFEQLSDPDVLDFAAGISYGGAFVPERFYAGVKLDLIQSNLAGEKTRGLAGNGSVLFMPGAGFRLALVMRNWGTKIKYHQTKESLPATLALGCGQELFDKGRLRWGLGATKAAGYPIETGLGVEYNLGKRMNIRASYTLPIDSILVSGFRGVSLGLGFRERRYSFEYAWAGSSPQLGFSHYLTLTATVKELTPKTADDYFKMALRHFKRGKYQRCIEEAENALRVNPNQWKSHALIARAYSMMRKFSGVEIALIYTGNTRGVIVAEQQGPVYTGGIARRATVVKQLALQNPHHFIVDAGNLFSPKTEDIKIEAMLNAMSKMGCTVFGTATGEIQNGLDRIGFAAEKLKLNYLATNAKGIKPFPAFVTDKIITVGEKYQVYVASVIGDQYQNMVVNDGVQLRRMASALRERIQAKGAKADLRVVLVNDDDVGVRYLAQEFPDVEIIISGMSGKVYAKPVAIGKTLILSPGTNGRYVGMLTIQFSDKKQMLSFQHRLIRLTQEVPEDPEIADLMNQMLIKVELEKIGEEIDLKRGNIAGTFLFVSDRKGTKNIYLKFMKSNTEYRLTSGPENQYEPTISVANGKVAYVEKWVDNTSKKTYCDLWTMELAGAKKRRITFQEQVASAVWHPNGKRLYFCSDSTGVYEIYSCAPEGGDRANLSQSSTSNETEVAFLPKGTEMAFVTDRDGKKQIYLSGTDGKNAMRLTEEDADHTSPKLSPDGKYLGYLSSKFGFGGKKDLAIYDRLINKTTFFTQNANVRSFVWVEEGSKIVYDAGANLTDLNVVSIAEAKTTKLLPSETIKTYSEQNPTLFWYQGGEWILYEQVEEKKTTIRCVRVNGTEDQTCVAQTKNNWLP